MNTYKRKTAKVTAVRWFKNGDHPEDYSVLAEQASPPRQFPRDALHDSYDSLTISKELDQLTEGLVVRRFRHPDISGRTTCLYCYRFLNLHGWVDTPGGNHLVCPGDWVITEAAGERHVCNNTLFKLLYESIDGNDSPASTTATTKIQ